MTKLLDDNVLKTLFTEARTHGVWLDQEVSDELLVEIYNIAKMGPTSAKLFAGAFRFPTYRGREGEASAGAYPSQS